MSTIREYLEKIKTAVYGKDVRQAINDAIRQCYDDGRAGAIDLQAREDISGLDEKKADKTVLAQEKTERQAEIAVERARINQFVSLQEGSTTGDAELIDARVDKNGNAHDNVGDHIREVTSQLSSEIEELCLKSDKTVNPNSHKAPYDDLDTYPLNKIVTITGYNPLHSPFNENFIGTVMTISNVNESVSVRSQIIITHDGKIYHRGYVNSWKEWVEVFTQNNNVMHGTALVNPNSHEAPYDDMNTIPVNTIVSYTGYTPKNAPLASSRSKFTGTVLTFSHSDKLGYNVTQIVIDTYGNMYSRLYTTEWKAWNGELDKYMTLSVFQKIGVIGDSYASGEIYADDVTAYGDVFELSWGQIMARQYGASCLNLSSGGLSTRDWLTHEKGLEKLQSSEAQQLYLIALGINDIQKIGISYLGSASDIQSGADTFYGNYAKIINAIKEKAPNAKIICMTISGYGADYTTFSNAIKEIANTYKIPFVVTANSPFIKSDIFWSTMISGHPIALTYGGMAKAYAELIEQCMAENMEYFIDYHG